MLTSPRPSRLGPHPASLAELGALLGDPVRASILLHLSDGSRRPAGELAHLARASPQAVTAHLARLVEGGLLAVEPQGRHRFFRIASGEAAEVIESLANGIDHRRAMSRTTRRSAMPASATITLPGISGSRSSSR